MRYILALIIILAIAIPSFIGFGANLSKNYTVSVDAVFERPVEQVWQVMSDYQAMPSWSKVVVKTQKRPDMQKKPVWRLEFADEHHMELRLDEVVPLHMQKAQIVATDLPYVGTLITEFTQINDTKTAVRIVEEVGMKGIFSRLFMHYFQDQEDLLRDMLKDAGEELARRPLKPVASVPDAAAVIAPAVPAAPVAPAVAPSSVAAPAAVVAPVVPSPVTSSSSPATLPVTSPAPVAQPKAP